MTLDDLKRIEEAATEGPWMIIDRRMPNEPPAEILTIFSAPRGAHGSVICRIQNSVKMGPLETEDDSNAAFITTFRNHAAALIRVAEAANKVVSESGGRLFDELQFALRDLEAVK